MFVEAGPERKIHVTSGDKTQLIPIGAAANRCMLGALDEAPHPEACHIDRSWRRLLHCSPWSGSPSHPLGNFRRCARIETPQIVVGALTRHIRRRSGRRPASTLYPPGLLVCREVRYESQAGSTLRY